MVAVAIGAAALVSVAVIAMLYAQKQHHFAIEQARARKEITVLATQLGTEKECLRTTLAESNRLLAIRNFDRGQAAFEKEQIGQGLLWMIESWRSAIAAGDPVWQHAARANLAAWQPITPGSGGFLPLESRRGRGFQPRRQDDRDGRRRPDGAALGHRDGEASRPAPAASRRGLSQCRLQPRRQDDTHGQRRRRRGGMPPPGNLARHCA